MAVITLSKETIDKIRTRAGIDERRLKEAVETLQCWLRKQPHLPHDYGRYKYMYFLQSVLVHSANRVKDVHSGM
jgi:hypothetical protein